MYVLPDLPPAITVLPAGDGEFVSRDALRPGDRFIGETGAHTGQTAVYLRDDGNDRVYQYLDPAGNPLTDEGEIRVAKGPDDDLHKVIRVARGEGSQSQPQPELSIPAAGTVKKIPGTQFGSVQPGQFLQVVQSSPFAGVTIPVNGFLMAKPEPVEGEGGVAGFDYRIYVPGRGETTVMVFNDKRTTVTRLGDGSSADAVAARVSAMVDHQRREAEINSVARDLTMWSSRSGFAQVFGFFAPSGPTTSQEDIQRVLRNRVANIDTRASFNDDPVDHGPQRQRRAAAYR